MLFYRHHFHHISGQLLYIAPERNVDYFRMMPGLTVKTSEYSPEITADFHYDLLDIDSGDSAWDFIICHRVLEHVANDRLAMGEIYRILKPGGVCMLSVPIDRQLAATREYGEPNPYESDHYYRYGTDFVTRIPEGFSIETHEFRTFFTSQEFQSLGLYDDFIFVCRKTV